MFTIAGAIKMFGGKIDKFIQDAGGKLVFSAQQIEDFCIKEKIPYKLQIVDGKIVITKR